MRMHLLLIFVILAITAYSQGKEKYTVNSIRVESVTDSSMVVVPTPYQIETLQSIEGKIAALQAEYKKSLLLILGLSESEIDSLNFKNDKFFVKLKRKPKLNEKVTVSGY